MKYFISLALLLLSNVCLSDGRIEIATEDQNGIRWLDFYGESIPSSYGMELEVFYPVDQLSVVDVDDRKSGPQILKGEFFSDTAYEISNNVDVRTGRIRYAISLLKPAKSVAGSGHLARIGFINRTNKASNIELANIKFGTQSGGVVKVLYPSQVVIEPALSLALESISNGFKPPARKLDKQPSDLNGSNDLLADNKLIIVLLGLIGLLLLIVIILLARRQPVQAS
jgi:hypothetical protein